MATKKEIQAQDMAKALGAGKPIRMEATDFSTSGRSKSCLEVDFPILPINSIAKWKPMQVSQQSQSIKCPSGGLEDHLLSFDRF